MKTRKSASKGKTAAAKDPTAKTKGKVRTRLTGVRGRVLSLLAEGPLTSSELVAKGGFSAASLYLNMKTLKKDGMVKTVRNGRSVSISLADGASASPEMSGEPMESTAAATPKRRGPGKKRGRPAGVKSTKAPTDLSSALAGLTARLSPIARSAEKIRLLDQLAQTLPGPVAVLLKEISADLARQS